MGVSKEKMVIHAFCATFFFIPNEKKLEWGFDGDIIEALLAHKEIPFGMPTTMRYIWMNGVNC